MTKHYKSPKTGRVYANEPIWTPVGRLAWVYLKEPKTDTFDGKDTIRYKCSVILPKGDIKTENFLAALDTLVNEKNEGMLALYNDKNKTKIGLADALLQDGDESDLEKYPYYANSFILGAAKPGDKSVDVRGPKGKGDLVDPAFLQGGMMGRLLVVPHIGPTGLSFKLEVVQFAKDDGVRFGGSTRNLDKFLDAIDGECSAEECAVEASEDALPEEEAAEEAPPAPVAKVVAPKVTAAPVAKANPAAAMRAQMAAKAPAGGKVVTTGKGKNLALNNL